LNERILFLPMKRSLVLAIIALFCATGLAIAQTATTGQVTGKVTDPSGAVISGASVTIKNTGTGTSEVTKTNDSGLYSFSFLQPGSYSLTIAAQGFQTVTQNVSASIGSAATVNTKLAIATGAEVVEVTTQSASVDTEDANLTTTFNGNAVATLPNPGNDLSAVALTAPGVVMNTTGGSQFGGGNFSVYGLPATSNLFTYDGANDNDPYFNVNNSGAVNLTLGLNDVQEAAVVSNGYSGTYGGGAGANINYISKSGSNQFHGNAEYWWNGRAMNANSFFNNENGAPRNFVNANQWATSFGGPIKKDKAFFFVDYEGIRLVIPSPTSVNVPTPGFANAVLGNLAANGLNASLPLYQSMFKLFAGAPGIGRAQNTLPFSGCGTLTDPNTGVHSQLVTTVNGSAFGPANPCALNFQGGSSAHTNDYLWVGRYDQNLTKDDSLFVRVQHEVGSQATFTDPLSAAFNAVSAQPEWQSQVSETHTFGANKVNNLVLSMQWYSALFTFQNPAQEASTFPQLVTVADGTLQTVNALGNLFPQGRNVTQYSLADDFSWAKGRHNFKVGFSYRRDDVSDHNFTGTVPAITLGTLQDFVNGNTGTNIVQNFPTTTDVPISLYQLGFYGADDVRVTSNLKLTLSLRFDHLSNPVCQTNCFQRLASPFQTLDHAGPVDQAILTGQHNAFPSVTSVLTQPRVGFAWSPMGNNKTVVRGGFGVFVDTLPTGAIDSFLQAAPLDPQFSVNTPTGGTAQIGSLLNQLAANNAQFRSNFASGGAVPAFNFYNSTAVKVPRYYEWSLEVQHTLPWHSSMTVKYVGNHGEHEEISDGSLNAFQARDGNGNPIPFANFPVNAPDSRFGVVSQQANIANSNYHGLVTTFQHSMTGGIQFQASYTYSHSLDEISNNSLSPFGVSTPTFVDVIFPQDSNNIRKFNYGSSDYDLRHSFNANYVWSDAIRHLTSWGPNALVKGWTFAGTVFVHSGFPFTPYSSNVTQGLLASQFGLGVQSVFAAVTGPTSRVCGPSGAQLNTPCFTSTSFTDPTGTFAPATRNQFRGPGFVDTDMNVEKAFALPGWEKSQLTVGARFFNLFNHPNFALPVSNIDNSQFGRILSTVSTPTSIFGSGLGADASPRLIQLEAKIVF